DRCNQAIGQDGAVIGIAVIGCNRAGKGRILAARGGVQNRDGPVVGAGQRDGQRRARRSAVRVGDRVVGDGVGRRALGEVRIGGVARSEAVVAIGIDGQTGDRSIEAVGQCRVIDVAVVGRNGAGDGAVLVARV